jgi:N-carbamoyl-L-amino-acid hydrolase
VAPNSPNVIPERTTITWDLRDPNDEVVSDGYNRIVSEITAAAEREEVDWECEEIARVGSIDFANRCIETIRSTADKLGYSSMDLVSGAGHDASHVARVCDTGMVFAVSEDGKSHTPSEFTSWEDCYRSATTFANAVVQLANSSD